MIELIFLGFILMFILGVLLLWFSIRRLCEGVYRAYKIFRRQK
jgi:hypothetical protein